MGSICAKDEDRLREDTYSWIESQGPDSGRSSLGTKELKNAALSNGNESYFSVDKKNLNSNKLSDYYSIVINPNTTGGDSPPKSMIQNKMNKISNKAENLISKLFGYEKINESEKRFNYPKFGPVFYDDGSTYKGQFKRGQKSGYGEIVYIDGSVYRGFWENDQKSGYGVIVFHDGDYYQGNFDKDKANGLGIKIIFYYFLGVFFDLRNGEVFEGTFRDNMRHGMGVLR